MEKTFSIEFYTKNGKAGAWVDEENASGFDIQGATFNEVIDKIATYFKNYGFLNEDDLTSKCRRAWNKAKDAGVITGNESYDEIYDNIWEIIEFDDDLGGFAGEDDEFVDNCVDIINGFRN